MARSAATGRTTASNRLALQDMKSSYSQDISAPAAYITPTRVVLASSYTIATWCKFTPTSISSPSGYIFGDTVTDAKLGWNTNYQIAARVEVGGVFSTSSYTVTRGKWHFIVLRKNADLTVDVSLDGATPETLYSGIAQTGNTGLGYIGRTNVSQNFYGKLSNFMVFDGTALTNAQITELYVKGTTTVAPTLHYPLDEGAGTTAYDSSGNGNNGTITNGTYDLDTPTKKRKDFGRNLVYNGDFEYAPLSTTPHTSGNQNWIDNTTNGSSTNNIFGWSRYANTALSGSGISYLYDSTVSHSGTTSLKVSTLSAGNNGTASNRSATFSTKDPGSIPVQPSTSYTMSIWVKTQLNSGSATTGARAGCSEYTASGSYIKANSALPSGVITTTDWTQYTTTFTTSSTCRYICPYMGIAGNDGTGTLIMDAWFDDISLTRTNRTTADSRTSLATGRFGNAIRFKDGRRDKVSYEASGLTYNTGSLSFWANMEKSGGSWYYPAEQVFWWSGYDAGGFMGLITSYDSISLTFWNSSYSADYISSTAFGHSSLDSWHHITVTWADHTMGGQVIAKFYLDGELIDTRDVANTKCSGIGTNCTYGDTPVIAIDGIVGQLDNFATYDRVLTDAEVYGIYADDDFPTSGLLALHKFDEESGPATDSSGNGNTGTITATERVKRNDTV